MRIASPVHARRLAPNFGKIRLAAPLSSGRATHLLLMATHPRPLADFAAPPSGALRIFTVAGIDVFVHWSWLLIAVVQIQLRESESWSYLWSALEYLALFAIVLLHEFGHALACRSVGGQANRIVLWPLGGVAYVAPPQRPGATLWSIAAGPLVNVALAPVLYLLWLLVGASQETPLQKFFFRLSVINAGLFVFNMLPIYPLDGGQILRSLLWYFVGRARSLMAAAVLGFLGAGLMGVLALYWRSIWLGILAFFNAQRAQGGFSQARLLRSLELAVRHAHAVCPACAEHAPIMGSSTCTCGHSFDALANYLHCPHCGRGFEQVACPYCYVVSPAASWFRA